MSTKPMFAVIFFGGIFLSMFLTVILCQLGVLLERYINYKKNQKAAKMRITERNRAYKEEQIRIMNEGWIGVPFTKESMK